MAVKSVNTGVAVAKAEAEEADIIFVYDEEEYTLPHPKLWPIEAVEAQEEGRMIGVLKALLGEAQYAKFKRKQRTVQDINDLMEASFKAVDTDQGK